jgi:ribosome-associated translation inhibitor RaiA
MRIDVHAHGLPVTNYTRDFAESRLVGALGRFRPQIASVVVNLAADDARGADEPAVCEIAVTLSAGGAIRRHAAHQWPHVAIDRAARAIADAVGGRLRERAGERSEESGRRQPERPAPAAVPV